jgi:ABC-2 type transport system permease protein
MTTTAATFETTPTRSVFDASRIALGALMLRDLVVLKKTFREFVLRTLIQPFLLCFVFLFVFPKIGQAVGGSSSHGGGASAFATVLVPGVVGISIMFQGVQSIALVMAQEFGFTREIEDRVQAPCPIWLVAVSKILSGAVQGLIAAAIVFPIASVVHAAGVTADISLHWLIRLRERGDARRLHQCAAHASLRHLSRHGGLLRCVLVARSAELPSAGSFLIAVRKAVAFALHWALKRLS